jgi:hypothetical protein
MGKGTGNWGMGEETVALDGYLYFGNLLKLNQYWYLLYV